MRIHRLILVASIVATACGGTSSGAGTTPDGVDAADDTQHDAFVSHFGLGMGLQESERCAEAIEQGYDPAIAAFEAGHRGERIVGSRVGGGAGTEPSYTVADYADALYLAAFCSVELGDLDRAEAYLRKALTVLEHDPLFESELGHVQQARGDFEGSLVTFQAAVDRARALEGTSPDVTFLGMSLTTIRHRAMRGVGYSLGELRRFDEAEAIYRAVLEEDPSDERSQEELQYIAAQRN